ncbi:hypothetical protein VTO73DRAFT_5367 [Trametes versicolor]
MFSYSSIHTTSAYSPELLCFLSFDMSEGQSNGTWRAKILSRSDSVSDDRPRTDEVGNFFPNTPGDSCDDQVSACCCNTVAFQLSMLCMNCQQDTLAGNQIGIDAGVGAYGLYRGTCGAGTNNSLPADIQQAVCNLNIKLDNYLYGGWADGSWFYVYTKENAVRDHAVNNNNTFTHCANQISPSATPTSSSSTALSASAAAITSQGDSSKTSSTGGASATSANQDQDDGDGKATSSSPTGAIAGGVVGGVVVIAAIVGILLWRRRSRGYGGITRGTQEPHHDYEFHIDGPSGAGPHMTTPFTTGMVSHGGAVTQPSNYSSSQAISPQHGHAPSSWSDLSSPVPVGSDSSGLRHTDAGVVIPLARSASGRLPPAYRSWEDDSNVGSDVPTSHQGSASSPSAPASEVSAHPNMPLVPLRLEEKASYSGRSS